MKRFFKGFIYAANGLLYCVQERNFRFHLIFAFFTIILSRFFMLTKTEMAILILTITFVIAVEAVNSGIERAVEVACGKEINPIAKAAKDIAAGAVLISAIGSVWVGIMLFWNKSGFISMYEYYKSNILNFIILILAIILGFIFVFWEKKIDRK